MRQETVFEFGTLYPIMLQALSAQARGENLDNEYDYLIAKFTSIAENLGINLPANNEDKLRVLCSLEFMNKVSVTLSHDENEDLSYAWTLGRSMASLIILRNRESDPRAIQVLENEINASALSLDIHGIHDLEIKSVAEMLKMRDLEKHGKQASQAPIIKSNNSVFIVHGHDENVKTNVARFIENIGFKAVVLHEQPNQGRTIIEKFEANAADSCFAVVLLTPDDIAASKEYPDKKKPRARQNVILELGYFCGALGRKNVCVLYKGDVEMPSDYLGVVYTNLDDNGGWHLKLAQEMKAAGLKVDLNKIL